MSVLYNLEHLHLYTCKELSPQFSKLSEMCINSICTENIGLNYFFLRVQIVLLQYCFLIAAVKNLVCNIYLFI